jgi:hypothetical protein
VSDQLIDFKISDDARTDIVPSRHCGIVRAVYLSSIMRASAPLFVALASVLHAEPTVFTVRRRCVAGSLDVGILGSLHKGKFLESKYEHN